MRRWLRKIDITPIVAEHIRTLRDYRTGKVSYFDLALFLGLPLVVGAAAAWSGLHLRAIAVTGVLTASALFVALLLNLLVMVLTYLRATKGDPADQLLQLRKTLLSEVAVNLSFCILTAIGLVATALAGLFGLGDNNPDLKVGRLSSSILITGAFALLLGLLMILRRIFFLIRNEFEAHKLGQTESGSRENPMSGEPKD
ncbi:MAG: hypothetical protein KIT09_16185 [Bryobacteraceae bacterium]|nr:hypothetical protein [Bryobacteraceae bacterium]